MFTFVMNQKRTGILIGMNAILTASILNIPTLDLYLFESLKGSFVNVPLRYSYDFSHVARSLCVLVLVPRIVLVRRA